MKERQKGKKEKEVSRRSFEKKIVVPMLSFIQMERVEVNN